MRFSKWVVSLGLATGMLAAAVANATPWPAHRTIAVAPVGNDAPATADDASGGEGRWARRIKHIAEVAGCALDGAAAARVFIVGVSGVGGVVATAVIAVAALACMGG